jgi:1,4-alpha-glucan branching enzyme
LPAGQPVVKQLLLEALRWWVVEYQVDGFCFVNAENLTQVGAVAGSLLHKHNGRWKQLQT